MSEHHIRRVPTALLIAVVVQTVGGLVWAGGAAARIATLEQRVGEQRLVAERLSPICQIMASMTALSRGVRWDMGRQSAWAPIAFSISALSACISVVMACISAVHCS